jgi:hypothetical protein
MHSITPNGEEWLFVLSCMNDVWKSFPKLYIFKSMQFKLISLKDVNLELNDHVAQSLDDNHFVYK